MGGEFKLSAQDSDLEYFFEPHQTFWIKETFNCLATIAVGYNPNQKLYKKCIHKDFGPLVTFEAWFSLSLKTDRDSLARYNVRSVGWIKG